MLDAIRMADGDDNRIEGWLVPFDGHLSGGRDSYGTRFSARTEYALDWFSERPLMYQHGMDGELQLTPVGTIRSLEIRDKGVWMQAQLDAQGEYFASIRDMVKGGKLFLSSGSVEHLVQIDRRSGDVTRWPIIEGSLTPTPANLLATIPVHTFRAAVRSALPEDLIEGNIVHPGAMRATDEAADPASRTERSFEDIRGDISRLINPMMPYGGDVYRYVVATFPDHAIVCECDMTASADDEYYRIPYTLGPDSEPVLGAWEAVEQAYIPVAMRSATGPLMLDGQIVIRMAHALAVRTQDHGERRFREGRELSKPNLSALDAVADGLEGHARTIRGLTKRARDRATDKAQAARWADPAFVDMQIALLDL